MDNVIWLLPEMHENVDEKDLKKREKKKSLSFILKNIYKEIGQVIYICGRGDTDIVILSCLPFSFFGFFVFIFCILLFYE